MKNQWGWGGFTTRDLKRRRLMAGCVALVFNWWICSSAWQTQSSSRGDHQPAVAVPGIGRQTSHAGRTTVTVTSSHGEHERARTALTRIAGFFAQLRKTAEQFTALERWYQILTQALKEFSAGKNSSRRGNCRQELPVTVERSQKPPAKIAKLRDLG